ncbi:unnamed protein product [Rotaria sp. Silwood1]|nr:unnamed protein product [Rotaria sp. Silwood1]
MLFKVVFLTCLLLIKFFIQPTTCALSNNIQNLEFDDITTLWDKFPSIIDKIKETVNRFRCPKGWKRLGGSCYYLPNFTSTYITANHTCNHLHSNLSNLIQIRNAVELFYAAHVLARNDLSSLMVSIDPNLFKGKKIAEVLMNDQGRWNRMKSKFHEVRVKYRNLRQKIVDRLSSTGLRILTRSKKIKQTQSQQPLIHDENQVNNKQSNITNISFSNETTINIGLIINNSNNNNDDDDDEYEYDDLDSSDESDEFEQIDDIHGICDQVAWNALDDSSTVYILTTYIVSDKIVCSLSDVESNTEYHHICEYVLDFCFANIICGKHGHCVNTLAGFKCSCSFLYGGLLCEKISEHGQQIVISLIFILILIALSFKPIRGSLWFIVKKCIKCCKKYRQGREQRKTDISDDRQRLVLRDRSDNDIKLTDAAHLQQVNETYNLQERRPTIAQEIIEFLLPRTSNPLLNPIKRNLVRSIWVGVLSISFLSILFLITTIMYLKSFVFYITDEKEGEFSINDTIHLVKQCESISDYRRGNLIFSPFALTLIFIFSWSIKRDSLCKDMCDGRPGLLSPIEPFRTGNRFTTATVFGIIAYEVLKIFEELLFSAGEPSHQGVLVELLQRIAVVILVGLRYYPVLASLQLRNIVARFFSCLYILCDIIYTIVREGSCMGFLPLSGQYTVVEEAKLRRVKSLTSDIPTPLEWRPPSTHRVLSVPVSVVSDYPQSPAERYIANRAQMLYDVIAEQMNTPHISSVSQTPTVISSNNQQQRTLIHTNLSDQSLGFHLSPDIIIHPPSDSSTKSKEKQVNDYPMRRGLQQGTFVPSLFQPLPTSNQSTADYPLAASSILTSPTFCTQMSHDQHMQAWRQNQVEKIQKKRRHCYMYGTPSQQPLVDRVSTATILTPQILSTTIQQQAPPTTNDGKIRREPTLSPFRFPIKPDQLHTAPSSTTSDIQVETNNRKLKRNRRQKKSAVPRKGMERLDEDVQETSNANKSLKMTSALIHRKDADSSSSDVTGV